MSQGPLRGCRVLVTAEVRLGIKLGHALTDLGGAPLFAPCIRIEAPRDRGSLRGAICELSSFDWIIVTSRNGVYSLRRALERGGVDPSLTGPRAAAVGPSTGRLLEEAGFRVDLIPPHATSASLLEAIKAQGVGGLKVLLLQGDQADHRLSRGLERAGAELVRVEAYRTIEGVEDASSLQSLVTQPGGIQAVTLMSGSAARALRAALGDLLFRSQRLICIGPATAKEVGRVGGKPARVASPHTIEGLVEAVVAEVRVLKGDF